MQRLALCLLACPAVLLAAPALEIVKPSLSQMEGGPPNSEAFEYISGETLFMSCRVSGFGKDEELHIDLAYSVQAFDPQGRALDENFKAEIHEQVLPQDKDWLPKIATAVAVPPIAIPGRYSIMVKVDDRIGKSSTELSVPFRVRGRAVELSDSLVIRNLAFYRSESDNSPMSPPVYKGSPEMWARFDIVGYRYGPKNELKVSYQTSILGAGGQVLWTQPEPAVDETQSFYPKPYVPAAMGLSLEKVKPGSYTILVEAKDAIGNQACEERAMFTVQ